MPAAAWAQTSFLGGEISATAQGRFDDPVYRIALEVCLNMIPIEAGAATRRPGTQHAGTTRSGAAGRLLDFDFQANAPYQIELTDGHMRFWNGPNLVTTNDSVTIAAISTANPAVVQLNSAVTWSSNDQGYFTLLGTSCPMLQNRQFILTKIDTTHFSIADAVTGAAIDGSTLGVGSLAAGAKLNRALDIASSPYTGGAWAQVRYAQVLSVTNAGAQVQAVLVHPTVQPYSLAVLTPPAGSNYATFLLSPITLIDGPYLDPVTSGETITISASSGSVTITASGSAFGGFKSTDVGRSMRFLIEPPLFNSGLSYSGGNVVSFPATTLTEAAVYWRCTAAGSTSVAPGTDTTAWVPWPATQDVAVWSWAIITAVTDATHVTASLELGIPIYSTTGGAGSPPTLPITLWRLGAYSATTGYPTCATFAEGRLWLAGAIGNRIDASVPGQPFNFPPTDIIGTVSPASAIAYTFNSPDINPIFWMVPDLQGIICGTKAGEWLVQAPTTGGIAPNNITARRVTKIGCANIEARRTDHTTVFVQKYGRKLMEYFADIFSGKFAAPHLTKDSRQLTIGGIQELAYQQELAPIVWARVDNGLVGWTYKRDSLMSAQGPTFSAGHRHELGSGRDVESISVGTSIDGTLDSLSMVTNDPATNVRHVEIMTNLWEEGDTLTGAWYLDDAVAPSSYTFDMNALTLTLNGLWHLNGKLVAAFVAGLDVGDYTVANGSITVHFDGGTNPLFISDFIRPFLGNLPAVIGFPNNSDGQILRLAQQKDSGVATGSALGKMQRANLMAVLVADTCGGNTQKGLQFGTDFGTTLKPALFRQFYPNGPLLTENQLFNGVHRASLTAPYSIDNDRLTWRAPRALPATICAINLFQEAEA